MQILCYKDSLEIIIFTRGKWETPGEFTSPKLAVIEIACSVKDMPVEVEALGETADIDVSGYPSYRPEMGMGHIYKSATVIIEPVPEVV
jgi:hypothetical protein